MTSEWYKFRGFSHDQVRAARAIYLGHFPQGGRILDIGAGRGEFLTAARDSGFQAEGLDSDHKVVAEANKSGLRVVQADAHDFLLTHTREFDGIFCAHVIEHFAPDDAKRLINSAAGALNVRGVLCVVTPNPGSLPTVTHEFWRDPSHVRLYDLEALEFLCHSAGLEVIESDKNPHAEMGLPVDPQDLSFDKSVPRLETPDPEQPRVAGMIATQFQRSRMARELNAVIHQQRMHIERLETHVELLSNSLHRLLNVLYERSEIYVVARRP